MGEAKLTTLDGANPGWLTAVADLCKCGEPVVVTQDLDVQRPGWCQGNQWRVACHNCPCSTAWHKMQADAVTDWRKSHAR